MKFSRFSIAISALAFSTVILISYVALRVFQTVSTPGFPWATTGSSEWSIDLIEQKLGLDIPSDAQEVHFEGRVTGGSAMSGWTDLLHLTFMALPESTDTFLEDICSGVLLQGFDPFRSEGVSLFDVSPDTIIIKMGMDTNYARLTEPIPPSVYGNRCWGDSRQNYVHEIMVDRSNPNLYSVNFMRFERNYEPRDDGPVVGGSPSLKVLEDSDVPIRVLGAVRHDDSFAVVAGELCIEMYPEQTYPYGSAIEASAPNPELFGAAVFISIDGQAAPSGYINDRQSLVPVDQRKSFDETGPWNYCLDNVWSPGSHEMQIDVITVSEKTFSYSWQFEIAE